MDGRGKIPLLVSTINDSFIVIHPHGVSTVKKFERYTRVYFIIQLAEHHYNFFRNWDFRY